MKVILTKKVANIGPAGTLKEVSPGFARNFLLRQGLAVIATQQGIYERQNQLDKKEKESATVKSELKQLAHKLEGLKLTIKAKANDQGKLFAGIDAKAIAKEFDNQHKIKIKHDWLELKGPIKEIGMYKVNWKVETLSGVLVVAVNS